jgi:hypothetical protein
VTNHYKIPDKAVAYDVAELKTFGGDLVAMVASRQDAMKKDRLNADRVANLPPSNPERDHLLDLCDDMTVGVDPDL